MYLLFRSNTFVIIFYLLLFVVPLNAIEIRQIVLKGNTIPGIMPQIPLPSDLTKKDIESVGVKITERYHKSGYTTSYVTRLVAKPDGILEIHIIESKIAGINVSYSGKEKEAINSFYSQLTGKLYNRYELEDISSKIKNIFDLGSVKIFPVNYQETDDVFLSVKVEKKSAGKLYGSVDVEPVYGVIPAVGYYYPFVEAAIDLHLLAGYGDGKFRRSEGRVRLFYFTGNESALYFGVNAGRTIDRWEKYKTEYITLRVNPVAGYRITTGYITFDFSVTEIFREIDGYYNSRFTDYDTRILADFEISNKGKLVSDKDKYIIDFQVYAGSDRMNNYGYCTVNTECSYYIMPVSFLRIVPLVSSYYTTSSERYYFKYIFDSNLLGFFNDYSASKFRNTAGLACEYEMSPDFIFAGPFINTGYYTDEYDVWKNKTGGGIKISIKHKEIIIDIFYAWDIAESPGNGGIFIKAGGRF